jgi:hypothetical protein
MQALLLLNAEDRSRILGGMNTSQIPTPTVALNTRVKPELAMALRTVATERGTSLADFMREALASHPEVHALLTPERPKRRVTRPR